MDSPFADRQAAYALVSVERPVETEPAREMVLVVQLMGDLGQQLVVVERLIEVARSIRRGHSYNRDAAGALVRREEMRLVQSNRPACPAAALRLLEGILGRRERVARIERFVTMEVIATALQRVGARPGDGIQDQAARVAELRLILAGEDLKFLDGVRRRVRSNRVDQHQFIADPVDERFTAPTRLAIGRDRFLGAASRDHPGRQQRQLRGVAAVERETIDLLARNDFVHGAVARVDERRLRRHRDCFGHAGDSQRKVDGHRLPDFRANPFAFLGSKPLQIDNDFVPAGRDERHRVRAAVVSHRCSRESSVDVAH
jgi:hypothetical protein